MPLTRQRVLRGRLASAVSVATGLVGVALALCRVHTARHLLGGRLNGGDTGKPR